jgi:hypothetical protein
MSCEVSMMTAHATNSIRMPIFAFPIGPISDAERVYPPVPTQKAK